MEEFYCLGDTIETRGGAFNSVITRFRSGWCKFRDLEPLLASKVFPFGTKGKLDSVCVSSIMLYRNETCRVKEEC